MNPTKWYQSKTLVFSIITIALGALTALQTINPETGWVVIAVGVLNAIIRLQTNTAIKGSVGDIQ